MAKELSSRHKRLGWGWGRRINGYMRSDQGYPNAQVRLPKGTGKLESRKNTWYLVVIQVLQIFVCTCMFAKN